MSKELNEQLGTTDVVWDLSVLYESRQDELVQDDLDLCQQEASLLAEFAGGLADLEPAKLARVVRRLERIAETLGRVATFAYLEFATNVKDEEAAAFLQEITEAYSRIGKETVYFDLEWSKMAAEAAAKFLDSAECQSYHHYLSSIRRYADHLLSQAEETLLLETGPVGRSSWSGLFTKVMGHLKYGPDQRGQEVVLADLYSPDRSIRQRAAQELSVGLQSQSHILGHIFNTLLADKMISDRLRSYDSWVSSRNLANELSDSTVDTLVESTVARYDIVGRYYKLKKRELGLAELTDYDRYAPLPNLPEMLIPWEQCRDMVLKGFADFSPEMANIAEKFFTENWIHAPMLEGKKGGAFAHPAVTDAHPFVLVNYTGNLRDVSTVAHELGHGVHQYLAREKGYFNSDTPLVLAETASVFAEFLIFHQQLGLLTDGKERRAFIGQKLESIFATVFRQISMNRFEDLAHNCRRSEGELGVERLGELWMESQQAMFGDSLTLTADYAIWWSYIPHFLSTPGYVYSYAFGELLVLSLYKIYQQEGEAFVAKYINLLAQGGSQSPYELLKPFGIDLNDPTFWQGGLAVIDEMLKELED